MNLTREQLQAILDGDTVQLPDDGRIRLDGFDAPEMDHRSTSGLAEEPGAHESRALTDAYLQQPGARIEVERGRDIYDRALGRVTRPGAPSLAEEQLSRGLAHASESTPETNAAFYRGVAERRQASTPEQAALNARLDAQWATAQPNAHTVHRDRETRGTFARAIDRGLDQMGMMVGGTKLLAGEGLEALGLESAGRSLQASGRAQVDENLIDVIANPSEAGTLENALEEGKLGTWMLEKVGEQGPNLAAMLGAAALTGGTGAVLGRAGAALAGERMAANVASKALLGASKVMNKTVGAVAAGGTLNIGESKLSLDEADPDGDHNLLALATGVAKTGLDVVGLSQVPGVGRWLLPIGNRLGLKPREALTAFGQIPAAVARATLTEGGTEALQELLDEAAARYKAGTPIDWSQVVEAGAVGALTGGVFAAPLGAAEVGVSRLAKEPDDGTEPPPADPGAPAAPPPADGLNRAAARAAGLDIGEPADVPPTGEIPPEMLQDIEATQTRPRSLIERDIRVVGQRIAEAQAEHREPAAADVQRHEALLAELDGRSPPAAEPQSQLEAQVRAVAAGQKPLGFIPTGSELPALPDGLGTIELDSGTVYGPAEALARFEADAARLGDEQALAIALGATRTRAGAAAQAARTGEPVVAVQHKDAEGNVLTEVAAVASEAGQQQVPGGATDVVPVEQAVAERAEAVDAAEYDRQQRRMALEDEVRSLEASISLDRAEGREADPQDVWELQRAQVDLNAMDADEARAQPREPIPPVPHPLAGSAQRNKAVKKLHANAPSSTDEGMKAGFDRTGRQPVRKVISGGQTGGDMGGLLAAEALGIETGGTAPAGWRTDKGANPALGAKFGLVEHKNSGYVGRTIDNINNADVTIAFRFRPSVGTDKTIGYAQTGKWQNGELRTKLDGHRPVVVVTTRDASAAVKQIVDALGKLGATGTVNIAGHRESSEPGIEQFVQRVVTKALQEHNEQAVGRAKAKRSGRERLFERLFTVPFVREHMLIRQKGGDTEATAQTNRKNVAEIVNAITAELKQATGLDGAKLGSLLHDIATYADDDAIGSYLDGLRSTAASPIHRIGRAVGVAQSTSVGLPQKGVEERDVRAGTDDGPAGLSMDRDRYGDVDDFENARDRELIEPDYPVDTQPRKLYVEGVAKIAKALARVLGPVDTQELPTVALIYRLTDAAEKAGASDAVMRRIEAMRMRRDELWPPSEFQTMFASPDEMHRDRPVTVTSTQQLTGEQQAYGERLGALFIEHGVLLATQESDAERPMITPDDVRLLATHPAYRASGTGPAKVVKDFIAAGKKLAAERGITDMHKLTKPEREALTRDAWAAFAEQFTASHPEGQFREGLAAADRAELRRMDRIDATDGVSLDLEGASEAGVSREVNPEQARYERENARARKARGAEPELFPATDREKARQRAAIENPKNIDEMVDDPELASTSAFDDPETALMIERGELAEDGVAFARRTAQYAGSTPLTKDQLDAIAVRVGKKTATLIRVVPFGELPAVVQETAAKQGANAEEIWAAYHDGAMYLVEGRHKTAAQVEEDLFHELYHNWLRGLLGAEAVKALGQWYNRVGRSRGLLELAAKYDYTEVASVNAGILDRTDMTPAQKFALIAEELIVTVGARQHSTPIRRLYHEALGAVRAWLRSVGLAKLARYTDSDIAHLLRVARKRRQAGGSGTAFAIHARAVDAARPINTSRRDFIVKLGLAGLLGGVWRFESTGNALPIGRARAMLAESLDQRVSPEHEALLRGDGPGAVRLRTVLEGLAENGPQELRGMIGQIVRLLPAQGIAVVVDDVTEIGAHAETALSRAGVTVRLYTAGERTGLTIGTLLHETLHAVVTARYRTLSMSVVRSNDEFLGRDAPKAAAALEQLRRVWHEFRVSLNHNETQRRTPAADKRLRTAIAEAERTPDEFFVRALTDEVFQGYLATLRYDGMSLLERFKNWVKTTLFGFEGTRPSWLDAALVASEDLLVAAEQDAADFSYMRAVIDTTIGGTGLGTTKAGRDHVEFSRISAARAATRSAARDASAAFKRTHLSKAVSAAARRQFRAAGQELVGAAKATKSYLNNVGQAVIWSRSDLVEQLDEGVAQQFFKRKSSTQKKGAMDRADDEIARLTALRVRLLRAHSPEEIAAAWLATERAAAAGQTREQLAKADPIAGKLQEYFAAANGYIHSADVRGYRANEGIYLPQAHDIGHLTERKDEYVQWLIDNKFSYRDPMTGETRTITPAAAARIAETLTTPHAHARAADIPFAGSLLDRVLTDPRYQALARGAGWLRNDPAAIMQFYTDTVVKEVEFERQFGDWLRTPDERGEWAVALYPEGSKMLRGHLETTYGIRIDGPETFKQAIARGTRDRAIAEFADESGNEVQYALYQRDAKLRRLKFEALKKYGTDKAAMTAAAARADHIISGWMGQLGADMSPRLRHAQQWVLVAEALTVLAFSAVSSIPEVSAILARAPSLASVRGAVRAVATDPKATARLLETLGFGWKQVVNVALLDTTGRHGMEGWPRRILEGFFKLNLQHQWTYMTRALSAEIGVAAFREAAEANDAKFFEPFHITPTEVRNWLKTRAAMGGSTAVPLVDQQYRMNPVAAALREFVNERVVVPDPSVRPTYMNNPKFQLIGQLKSFLYAYGPIIIGGMARHAARTYARAAARGDAKMMAAIRAGLPFLLLGAMGIPLAALAGDLKDWLKYDLWGEDAPDWREKEGLERTFELLRRSGALGPFEISASLFDETSPGFVAVLGPAAGHIDVGLTHGFMSMEFLRRSTPVLNQMPGFWKMVKED